VQSYEKKSAMQKKSLIFFSHCRVPAISAKPKLRKKLVKAKRFWMINAIRPETKAKRGRTKKFNLGQKANQGGLVKELGYQIAT